LDIERYRERNRTREEIRRGGAIGNLNEGIEIETHGVATRLIAWPGNGFQTQSVHVLRLPAGVESDVYAYDMAEEAMICLKGRGEVLLRGEWVEISAGDIAYFPERTEHALRNPATNSRDFVLVTQIAPPIFDLYEPAGLYNRQKGAMDDEAIAAARACAGRGNFSPENEMRLSETHPHLRAWNMSRDEIRRQGALFNVYKGAAFGGLDVPMVLVLWPGYGIRSTGFHFGRIDAG
jgi:gentisate 1,2-dioxygenase